MISKIVTSEKIGDKTYYYVEWTNETKQRSWVTKQVYPQINDIIDSQSEPAQSLPKPTLPPDTNRSQPVIDYLKWKSDSIIEEEKGKDAAKKNKFEGLHRYNMTAIDKLELKAQQMYDRWKDPNYRQIRLDYLVKNVEGIIFNSTGKLAFVISIIGRARKYVVPTKKMKKHFPKSLHDYLKTAIRMNKGGIQPTFEEAENEVIQQRDEFAQWLDQRRFDEDWDMQVLPSKKYNKQSSSGQNEAESMDNLQESEQD